MINIIVMLILFVAESWIQTFKFKAWLYIMQPGFHHEMQFVWEHSYK